MRILTIDIGNSAIKASILEQGKVTASTSSTDRSADALRGFIAKHSPHGAIACTVCDNMSQLLTDIDNILGFRMMRLDHNLPLPISIDYLTPNTLGLDRVATAAGASVESRNSLVVDAGSAVTIDLVCDNRFIGGNISPGMRMRFRALNNFTSRLPLLDPTEPPYEFGRDTTSAIQGGVIGGLVDEISASFQRARSRYPDIRLLLTGGDAPFLAPLLEANGIPVTEDHTLLARGLHNIYTHNTATNIHTI